MRREVSYNNYTMYFVKNVKEPKNVQNHTAKDEK